MNQLQYHSIVSFLRLFMGNRNNVYNFLTQYKLTDDCDEIDRLLTRTLLKHVIFNPITRIKTICAKEGLQSIQFDTSLYPSGNNERSNWIWVVLLSTTATLLN
jgi:hypothetical protein